MYQSESFSPFAIYPHIARFILAETSQNWQSLIFIDSHKGLKPRQLCLKLRQALRSELTFDYAIQLCYSTQATHIEIIPQAGCIVKLLYLPQTFSQASETSAQTPFDPLLWLEPACQTLAYSTTDCSAILWQSTDNHKLRKLFCTILPTKFPRIRFAQITAVSRQRQRNSKWTQPVLSNLLAILPPAQLAYLLKGLAAT